MNLWTLIFEIGKIFFLEKLENLGCMGLFDVSNEVYPQLVRPFYASSEKVEYKGKGRTYYTIKVKDSIITLTTAFIGRIFHVNHDLSKFLSLMLEAKACNLYLDKYAYPSKNPTNPMQPCTLTIGSSITSWSRLFNPKAHPKRPPMIHFLRLYIILWRDIPLILQSLFWSI